MAEWNGRWKSARKTTSKIEGRSYEDTSPALPLSAIVGQEELKQALLLNLIHPGIGGYLSEAKKGPPSPRLCGLWKRFSRKSTWWIGVPADATPTATRCARGVWSRKPFESVSRQVRVVDLPVGSTEDRVVGSLDMETALREGRRRFEPGILADANRGILYGDEINLLDDHLVDVLLDAAAMGVNTVEREGVSWSHPSRFVLVGTMNPEEGELRPQLLDRFGLCVEVRGMAEPEARLQVMTRRAAFEDDPVGFRAAWQERENEIAERIVAARRKLGSVAVPEDVMRAIVELAIETEVDGHRADIVMLKTVKAIAAWRGDGEAAREDVMQAARLVLPHRMRRKPFSECRVREGGAVMSGKWRVFPFTALVGQEKIKRALLANAVLPSIGGVLLRGEKGTAKSTAVRGLASLLPQSQAVAGCPWHCDPLAPEEWLCPSCAGKKTEGALPSVAFAPQLADVPCPPAKTG